MKSILTVLAGAAMLSQARAAVLSFEELPLGNPATDGSTQYGATGTYYWNGSNQSGGFASGGLSFQTNYTLPYGSWSGFGYSNTTDTATAGWTNQFSALSGGGAGGSSNYLIAYQDTYVGSVPTVSFSRRDLAGHGFMVTNTTYAGLSMRDGYFGSKKFGGTTGNDPDWFLMTITAYDTGLPGNSVSFYLADFRFANNALDYIVDDWTYVDLGSLGTADQLKITFSSSDNHPLYGMNTPAYAALDNFQVIPEAGGPVLAALGLAAALLRRRRCACLAVAVAGAGLAGLVPQPAMAGPYSSAYGDAENAFDAPVPGFVGPDGRGKARLPDGLGGFKNEKNYVNPLFPEWASAASNYQPADDQGAYADPTKATGPVTGDITDVVSLGEVGPGSQSAPGEVTMEFNEPISDKPGADVVVFENSLLAQYSTGGLGVGGTFAELGYVEVSSDGTNFARFPSTSLTPGAVGPYGTIDSTQVLGLAGKHTNGYGESWGTPFDLHQLADQPAVQSGAVDLSNIRFLRLVDIPGNGTKLDSSGRPIYDAYPTWDSGGLDVEAVGAISVNQTFAQWLEARLSDGDQGEAADPDGDGMPNLLEYALGTDPARADAQPPHMERQPDGHYALDLTRDTRAVQARLDIEGSSDMVHWDLLARSDAGGNLSPATPGATNVTDSSASDISSVGVVRRHQVSEAVSPAVRYLRVRASLLPAP